MMPPNLGTLGRGRVFVQKADEPAEVIDVPEAPEPEPAPKGPRKRSAWPIVMLVLLIPLFGAALIYLYRDELFPKPKKIETPIAKKQDVVQVELSSISAKATFFNTGPFDEQRLGDAFFAPDGRRYAFLYREGGESGFAGAGREKTPNMLELNKRSVHLGGVDELEASRRRLGYFEATDRFWYLARSGEQEHVILEDDQGELFDAVGPPSEAPKDKQIGYWAKKGDRWMVVVGDWTSAPYDKPIFGPCFSPNGDAFSFIVGGKGDRAKRGDRHVVTCSIETHACDQRPNNPRRSIEEYLLVGSEGELFFALDWYATDAEGDANENLEMMAVSKRDGRWQSSVITRSSASLKDVVLGEGTVDLAELAKRTEIEHPWIERIVSNPDGTSVAILVAGRTYSAGDGIMLRRSKDGDVAMTPEYVRCKFASKPFSPRDWLVMSKDESKVAFCTNESAHGERVVVNELKLKPYTYVMSPPVFSPDAQTVAYFAIKDRQWWAVAGVREDGPYDELFGEPRFSSDGTEVWYGARRGRTLLFVKMPLKGMAQPADAAVEF